MRNHLLAALALLFAVGFSSPARADIDLEGTLLVGSGVDTGHQKGNTYALQIGGQVELIINGFVGGFRATRAISFRDGPAALDLRSIGGDLGYEWEIAFLHIGPRVGLGYVSTLRKNEFESFYVEPGAVAEIEVGWFVVGADVRYRVVTADMDRNGLLVYGKIGLRF
jgi:hypothetical protein